MQKTWDEITPLLDSKLDPKGIKTRDKAGVNLSYVEAWHCIAEANRIFGYGCWSRETVYCKEVSRTQNADKHKVGYEAKVKITVGDVVREGTGHGSQVSKDLFDAIEGAAKEAESDAMKRALMTFGNPFGLALYDKKQEGVGKNEPSPEEKREKAFQWVNGYLVKIKEAASLDALSALETVNMNQRERIRAGYPEFYAMIVEIENERAKELA